MVSVHNTLDKHSFYAYSEPHKGSGQAIAATPQSKVISFRAALTMEEMTMTMKLWLKTTSMIQDDGFHASSFNITRQIGVEVGGGKITDIEYPDFTYTLTDDGVRDWAGNEICLEPKSFERLKAALS